MLFFYLYFPSILMNLLTLMSFMLPCESSEKITLSMSVLLTMTVYILLLPDLLPIGGDVPVILLYMVATYGLVAAALLMSIVVLKIHHNGSHDNQVAVPSWARRLFLDRLSPLAVLSVGRPDNIEQNKLKFSARTMSEWSLTANNMADVEDLIDESASTTNSEQLLLKALHCTTDFVKRDMNEWRQRKVQSEWHQLAAVIDRLCFFVMLIMMAVVWGLTFSHSSHAMMTSTEPRLDHLADKRPYVHTHDDDDGHPDTGLGNYSRTDHGHDSTPHPTPNAPLDDTGTSDDSHYDDDDYRSDDKPATEEEVPSQGDDYGDMEEINLPDWSEWSNSDGAYPTPADMEDDRIYWREMEDGKPQLPDMPFLERLLGKA